MSNLPHRHLPELQTIRGLAAAIVVLHHGIFYYGTSLYLRITSEFVLNAHAAVVVFFVLSGFVLTRGLTSRPLNTRAVSRFWISRFFRIYPALWSAAILGVLAVTLVSRVPALIPTSEWFGEEHIDRLSLSTLVLTSIGFSNRIVAPLWTIEIELMAAVFLPIAAYLVGKGGKGRMLLGGIWLLMIVVGLSASLPTVIYLADFLLGALLVPVIGHRFPRRESGLVEVAAAVLACGCLLLFRFNNFRWDFLVDYNAVFPSVIEALAAAALLFTVATSERCAAPLRHRALIWLGNTSYSLYLLHYPVMLVVGRAVPWFFPSLTTLPVDQSALLLTGVTLAVALPLSHLCYSWIELPGIAAGKRLLSSTSGLPRSLQTEPLKAST